ncbi:hypothetical protein PUNSTDRAFT_133772 [Punctularia strigosozonata HHB-11173 SS5]|uniref:uncharacterized protein n=1 Tax=Punctularia strigosozonata (strain HHB-11173) TaxID=741275 RepID=UPI00044185B7|nr:uncharacterized protein PUNSTDRAFT_133772 [Punctularia strigosozonata HHB-11173 SS5]EIN10001.1 hypothetical protein PUNSTDRAFT_133772 [Punctularia strigosozonata HHB-11173 SS5]
MNTYGQNYIAKPRFNPKIAHLACRTCGEKGHLAADHFTGNAKMNALDAVDERPEAEHEAVPDGAATEEAPPDEAENDETYYLEAYEAHQGNEYTDDYSSDGGEVVFMNELLVGDDNAHNDGRDPAPFAYAEPSRKAHYDAVVGLPFCAKHGITVIPERRTIKLRDGTLIPAELEGGRSGGGDKWAKPVEAKPRSFRKQT